MINYNKKLEKLNSQIENIKKEKIKLQIQLIKYAKYKKQMKSKDIAETLGISIQMLCYLETGRRIMTNKMFNSIVELIND